MSAADVEYFRQFVAGASLLGGFSFAFFGTLLAVPHAHRVVGLAAALALAASVCFLVVTVANTFAGAALGNPALLRTHPAMLAGAEAHVGPISGRLKLRSVPARSEGRAGSLTAGTPGGRGAWGRGAR